MESKTKQRRRHGAELKTRVLRACEEPGATVAGVAREYGLNDNLVHQWRRGRGIGVLRGEDEQATVRPAPQFVALPLPPLSPAATPQAPAAASIRLEIRRGAVLVNVAWPMTAAEQCAAWLREVLR